MRAEVAIEPTRPHCPKCGSAMLNQRPFRPPSTEVEDVTCPGCGAFVLLRWWQPMHVGDLGDP